MQLFSWLHKQLTGRPHIRRTSARKPTPRFRPQLEVLEDRWLPSMLTVTSSGDAGKGTLRYEIAHANNRDTIVFAPGIHTITLHSNDLVITARNLTIKGPGADKLTVTTDFISDDAFYGYYGARIFEVAAGSVVTISGLTLSNGTGRANAYSSSPNDRKGGAILNSGTLTISGCTVTGNDADYGGGIYTTGNLTVNSCTFFGNYADAYFGGDAIYNAGTLIITGSIFQDRIVGPYTDGGGNTFN
ncbi:MAG TPA: right-handed parallel beta-helix repeat-containing protein [Gemmataceae bacterium]|nr:right-handed parallel beta-helix repeat-containing protein [Gemmataceae bacterium]